MNNRNKNREQEPHFPKKRAEGRESTRETMQKAKENLKKTQIREDTA